MAGISATAPPNSTAKRSSEIAASTIGVRRTKCRPSSAVDERRTVGQPLGFADVGDAQDRHDRRQLQRASDGVRQLGPDRVEEPTQHRADDRSTGERRRPQRDGLWEFLRRRDQRRDRPARRRQHGLRRAERERDARTTARSARRPCAVRDERVAQIAAGEQEQRRDPPAVEPVGDPAAHEHQQDGGHELRQPEPPDVELVARQSNACLNNTVTSRFSPTEPSAVEARYRRTGAWRRTSRVVVTRRG